MIKKIVFLVLFFCSFLYSNSIVITQSDSEYCLSKYLYFYEESSKGLSFNEIKNVKFKEYKSSVPLNLGFTKNILWVKFSVENRARVSDYILYLKYSLMDSMVVYTEFGKRFDDIGYSSLVYNREIKDNYPNVKLQIPTNSAQTFYIKFVNSDRMQVPIYLSSFKHYYKIKSYYDILNGMLVGIVVIMMIYNILMYRFAGEKDYIFFVLFIFSYLFFQLTQDGIIHNYILGKSLIKYNHYVSINMTLLIVTILLFSKVFFQGNENITNKERGVKYDIYYQIFNVVIFLSTFLSLIYIFGLISYQTSIVANVMLTILTAILVMILGSVHIKYNKSVAIFFLTSWSILMIGGLFYSFMSVGFMPINVVTCSTIKIGAVISILMHSLSIGYKFNKIKKEAIQLNEKLMSERTQSLKNMEVVNKIKDNFIINASNELNIPLTTASKLLETTITKYYSNIPNKVLDNLRLILSQIKKLTTKIKDVLDYTKVLNNDIQLNFKTVNLKQLIDITINTLSLNYFTSKITVHNSVPVNLALNVDEDKILQVLYNIIDNAYRYTENGEVYINAVVEGDMAIISIQDTGIGIREEKLQNLFDIEKKSIDSVSSSFTNKGFGLLISKKIVEAHKGFLKVKSVVSKGTTVKFSLPLAEEKGYEANMSLTQVFQTSFETLKADRESSKKTILIVENDITIQNILYNMLSTNYKVILVLTAQEAISHLSKNSFLPNLILVDSILPDLSGFNFTKQVRQTYNMLELPIIIISSVLNENQLVLALNSGANDFFNKNFVEAEYMARIRSHIELSTLTLDYSRFLPKEIIQILNKENISQVRLGDYVKKEFTILFLDIRSFTSMSEKLSSREVFRFLNSFFARIAPIIRNYGGFIDKYVGDAILAIFTKDKADAIKASIEIYKQVIVYNMHRKKSGYRAIDIGIGLESGETMLGTIGEPERMDATVISDSVNIANRLEALNKKLGTHIITTITTLNGNDKFKYREIGKSLVKGKRKKLDLVEIFYSEEQYEKFKVYEDEYNEALKMFFENQIDEAQEKFISLLKRYPDDKLIKFYLEYIQRLKILNSFEKVDEIVLNFESFI